MTTPIQTLLTLLCLACGASAFTQGPGACIRSCNTISAAGRPTTSFLTGGIQDTARISLHPVRAKRSARISPGMVAWNEADASSTGTSESVGKTKCSLRPKKPVTIVVFGASGDLAKKKTFPALFSLFYHDLLPEEFQIIGYARKDIDEAKFRELLMERLTCRVDPDTFDPVQGAKCNQLMEKFLQHVTYFSGGYDDAEALKQLSTIAGERFENKHKVTGVNRLFYLAVPPTVFADSARSIKGGGIAPYGDTRVIIEKPFGRDSASYEKLSKELSDALTEEQIYRIDHYLGKELVQNIMALRFGNFIFEPLWDSRHIHSVQIDFKEPFGVEGRAGYFDHSGIVRDIMQNHLMQVLSLLAMEAPSSMSSDDIRDEKVKLLRSIETVKMDDFALGQYSAFGNKPGYHDDEEVPEDSVTPTFAACVLNIKNRRWDGVPFMIRAGKALDERLAQVRIKFSDVPGNLMGKVEGGPANELVIRLQPDEAIFMTIINKLPGLTSELTRTNLKLSYTDEWTEALDIPDAYERLILDAMNGEKALFCRDDELKEAWRIFNDALIQMESKTAHKPAGYAYGGTGPEEMHVLASKHGGMWA